MRSQFTSTQRLFSPPLCWQQLFQPPPLPPPMEPPLLTLQNPPTPMRSQFTSTPMLSRMTIPSPTSTLTKSVTVTMLRVDTKLLSLTEEPAYPDEVPVYKY